MKMLLSGNETRTRRAASMHLMRGVALAKNPDVSSDTILHHYESSRSILAEIGQNETHEYAALIRNIGLVKANEGDKPAFLTALRESLAVSERVKPRDHSMLLTFLFDIVEQEEDSDGNLEDGARYFDRAMKLADEQRLTFNEQNLQSLMNIGAIRRKRKDYTGALVAFEAYVKTHQDKGTTKSHECQEVFKAIAKIKHA